MREGEEVASLYGGVMVMVGVTLGSRLEEGRWVVCSSVLGVEEGARLGREEEREEGVGWEGSTREAWAGRGATVAAAWRVGEEPAGGAGAWRLASQA